MITISELQVKDIVAVDTGKKLGHLTDLDIDTHQGVIRAIVITTKGKVMGMFGQVEEWVIPWKNIINIGEDVILVRHVQTPVIKDYPKDE